MGLIWINQKVNSKYLSIVKYLSTSSNPCLFPFRFRQFCGSLFFSMKLQGLTCFQVLFVGCSHVPYIFRIYWHLPLQTFFAILGHPRNRLTRTHGISGTAWGLARSLRFNRDILGNSTYNLWMYRWCNSWHNPYAACRVYIYICIYIYMNYLYLLNIITQFLSVNIPAPRGMWDMIWLIVFECDRWWCYAFTHQTSGTGNQPPSFCQKQSLVWLVTGFNPSQKCLLYLWLFQRPCVFLQNMFYHQSKCRSNMEWEQMRHIRPTTVD